MNKEGFTVTVPANDLVNKINHYVITLWVNLNDEDGSYAGLFTEEEKQAAISSGLVPENTYWERVTLTLNELFPRENED